MRRKKCSEGGGGRGKSVGYGGVGDVWKSKKGEKGVGVERGWGGGGELEAVEKDMKEYTEGK